MRLPRGPRTGPQSSIEVVLDTNLLRAGRHLLALAQTGGKAQEVSVDVLPGAPQIAGLPLRVNLGEVAQKVVLKGAGLEKLESAESGLATIQLDPPGIAGERTIAVTLKPEAKKGDVVALRLKMTGASEALLVPGALLVAGPKPKVASTKSAMPQNLPVPLRDGEVPAGSFATFELRTENLELPASIRFGCQDAGQLLHALALRAGETREQGKIQVLDSGVLVASFDPGTIGRSGCALTVSVESEAAGTSAPVLLGRVVRLPVIEGIQLTNEKSSSGYTATPVGRNLETIERTGWGAAGGIVVAEPPRTLAGEGDRQTLRVTVPWPSPEPASPLHVWLRGDKEGRATRVAATAR